MSHYFINDPSLSSNQRQIEYRFKDEKFTFITDNGVFSKSEVDRGSNALIQTVADFELGDKVLDLGCGYGVIGIVIKRLKQKTYVCLVDINDRAISLSKTNANLNNTEVTVIKSEDITTLGKTFDSILLNPPIRAGKRVIYGLYKAAHYVLNDSGRLYIVIQKKHGSESSITELKKLFSEVKVIARRSGYQIIESIK